MENYLAVARHWRNAGVQIILGGGPADQTALEPARREGFAVSTGVPLLITGGLMQLSTVVLGGDTGALHLAVAQGKRVLMLMHQATPGTSIPYQHPDWVIAAPEPAAIAKIPIADVNAAIARFSTNQPVMFLAELQAKHFLQLHHPPMFFFARSEFVIRIHLKNTFALRQPTLHRRRMCAGK